MCTYGQKTKEKNNQEIENHGRPSKGVAEDGE
jgi:hypothetical protein